MTRHQTTAATAQPVSKDEGSKLTSLKASIARALPPRLVMHLRALDHYLNGERELRLLKQLVPRQKSAVDAGANIGTYSYFLRFLASVVYAYEPNPDLAGNLAKLLPTVRVRNVALSDSNRELVLKVPVDDLGRLSHELGSVGQAFDGETRDFQVACVTIDSEDLADVGFIKVDVEQHERQVLRGALATIRRWRPVLLVEVYPLKYDRSVPDEFSFITDEGYTGWFRFGTAWHAFRDFDQQKHAHPDHFGLADRFMANNVIFFPNEHRLADTGPST